MSLICELSFYQKAFKMFLLTSHYIPNIVLGTGMVCKTTVGLHPNSEGNERRKEERKRGRRKGERIEAREGERVEGGGRKGKGREERNDKKQW